MADDRERAVTLTVLDAAQADARRPELLDLAMRAKAGWGYDAPFMERFEDVMRASLAQDGLLVVVAEAEGLLTGFASVILASDPAWLEDLWVDPGRQGTGVGTALLEEVVQHARAAGATALEWESDPNAEPYYLARGARRVATHPSSIDPRRLLPTMRMDLAGR